MTEPDIRYPNTVTRLKWLTERKKLLAKEKEFTVSRDALNAERQRLPMVKNCVFYGPNGEAKLIDLFEGRRQLLSPNRNFRKFLS